MVYSTNLLSGFENPFWPLETVLWAVFWCQPPFNLLSVLSPELSTPSVMFHLFLCVIVNSYGTMSRTFVVIYYVFVYIYMTFYC